LKYKVTIGAGLTTFSPSPISYRLFGENTNSTAIMHFSNAFFMLLGAVSGAVAASIDDCPGYTATNVVRSATGLTADLTLAGPACNVYGYDLGALKLLVEYQTGVCSHT